MGQQARTYLSEVQTELLRAAAANPEVGALVTGNGWLGARALVNRGFGHIDPRAKARKGFGPSRFHINDAGRAALDTELRRLAPLADPLYPARALATAAAAVNLTPAALIGRDRRHLSVRARWAVALCCLRRGMRVTAIARRIGTDHSSVRYGLTCAEDAIARDAAFARLVREVDAA